MSDPVLEVSHLSKKFGNFVAVNDISFSVKEGEIVGLLGPNGAGKTTTIDMLLSLITPTTGTVSYFGKSLFTHREEILGRINCSSAYARFPWRLTVWENLDVFGHLYEVANHQEKISVLAKTLEITGLLNTPMSDLSAGQTTRVFLVKAFLNDPEIVLLDEPTASLDPDIAATVRRYILDQRKKRKMSLLITSHNMREVEEVCDRVIFLHHGKILATDTPHGLARRNTVSHIELMIDDGLKRLLTYLKNHHLSYTEAHRFVRIALSEKTIAPFLQDLASQKIRFSEIEIVRPDLEDFFVSVTHEEELV